MNVVFPEITNQPRQGKRSLRFSQILALAYCFGGASVLIALISKFIVTPLFEELTYERRVFVDNARNRLVKINALLTSVVKPRPLTAPKGPDDNAYIERAVSANDTPSIAVAELPNAQRIADQIEKIRDLRQQAKQMDPNDDIQRTHSALTSQTNELAKYARRIQYENVPTTAMFLPPVASGEPSKSSVILGRAIVECTKEIRSFKSALLS